MSNYLFFVCVQSSRPEPSYVYQEVSSRVEVDCYIHLVLLASDSREMILQSDIAHTLSFVNKPRNHTPHRKHHKLHSLIYILSIYHRCMYVCLLVFWFVPLACALLYIPHSFSHSLPNVSHSFVLTLCLLVY